MPWSRVPQTPIGQLAALPEPSDSAFSRSHILNQMPLVYLGHLFRVWPTVGNSGASEWQVPHQAHWPAGILPIPAVVPPPRAGLMAGTRPEVGHVRAGMS